MYHAWDKSVCGFCIFKTEPRTNGFTECRRFPPQTKVLGAAASQYPKVGGGTKACAEFKPS